MKPIEVGTFEAKNRLTHWLSQAERGQRIYITRRGRRVAMLSAVETESAPTPPDLRARFAAFRAGAKRGRESLKALVEEGR